MLLRTHLAISIMAILLFLPHITSKAIFVIMAVIATYLPDIDSAQTRVGSNFIAKLLTIFTRHRGMFHSLTFCLLITLVLAIFFPVVSLGFFLGYSLHIFSDSFTKEGVMPFWPWRKVSSFHLSTGGITETGFFIVISLADLLILFLTYNKLF